MEQMLEDVPNDIEVITSEDLEKGGHTDIYKALQSLDNVEVGGENSRLRIGSMHFSYTLVLINGHKLTGTHINMNLNQILQAINVNNIERIEVLTGAASVMYGAGAMGGVINIITKNSTEPGGAMTTSVENNKATANFAYDFGRVNNWALSLNGNLNQGLGQAVLSNSVIAATGELNEASKYSSSSDISTDWNLGLGFSYFFNDNHKVHLDYSHIYDTTISRYINQSTGERNDTVDALGSKNVSHNGSLTFSGNLFGHQYSIVPYISRFERIDTSRTASWYYTLGVDAVDVFALNDWNLITLGIDYSLSDTYNVDLVSAQLDNQPKMHTISGFAQDEMLLLDEKLSILPAVRVDASNYHTTAFTAKIGTTYEFIPNHRFKLNIGNAFGLPSLTQIIGVTSRTTTAHENAYIDNTGNILDSSGLSLEGATVTRIIENGVELDPNDFSKYYGQSNSTTTSGKRWMLGNPDIKPENAFAVDGRYEGEFGPFNTSIGGSYTIKKGELGTDIVGIIINGSDIELLSQYNNREKLTNYLSANADLGYNFRDYFSAKLAYTWYNNWDEDGYRLAYYATHNLSANLDFAYPAWDLFANISGSYKIDRQNSADSATSDNSVYAYNHWSLSASLGKTFKDRFVLVASASNFLQSDVIWENASNAANAYSKNGGWTAPTYKLTFTAKL